MLSREIPAYPLISKCAPFRTIEIAAERIRDGPQTGADVVEAIQELRDCVERWRLLYLWDYLQFDAAAEPHRVIGVQQNLNAALNGIAHLLKIERMDIISLAKLIDVDRNG